MLLPKPSAVTALIQVGNEWLENMDNGKLNGVIFLDVKKAFDSINHNILLNKMKKRFGIFSNDLKWLGWYLSSRKQQYSINDELSVSIARVYVYFHVTFFFPLTSLLFKLAKHKQKTFA